MDTTGPIRRRERRAVVLGAGRLRMAEEIAALEAEGWALEGVTTSHYGALTLIGHFRRPPAPAAVGDVPAVPDRQRES
jgi:hypothetical protein